MKPEEIKLGDWQRILFGEAPASFFLEIVIRVVIIFLLLIFAMRLFGPRMAAQVNRIEMIALFSLAAAIGVPLQAPDRGLLPAVVIAIVVLLVGRLVAKLSFRNQRFESISEDENAILVAKGIIQMKPMKKTRLTIERLYAQLRTEGIMHLGEVKRMYFEANGSFSTVKEERPRPGLSIVPGYDAELIAQQKQASDVKVCKQCGNVQPRQAGQEAKCANCGEKNWVTAVI